jgi:hypothetical protein
MQTIAVNNWVTQSAASSSTLLTDLVSFWALDEASGATRADSHGSNDLTDNNTVGQGTGNVYANAADFDRSSSEYLDIADAAQSGLDITGDMTILAWVNAESLTDYDTILSKWRNTGNDRAFVLSRYTAAGYWSFDLSSDGANRTQLTLSNSPSTSTWYLIAAWHDGTANEMGMSINNGTPQTKAHTGGIFNSSQPFYVGTSFYNTAFLYCWDGLIGPVSIYNRVLTASEITSLYNSGNGLKYSEL